MVGRLEEEYWLEEYNRDDNRNHAERGAHLALKRAEKARSLVNKLTAMVRGISFESIGFGKGKGGVDFTYDGIRLLSMLEEYNILRQEKEQEQCRLPEEKKIQGQFMAEQEALYGSKPSPSKTQLVKKPPRMSTGSVAGRRRLPLGGVMLQDSKLDSVHCLKAKLHPQPPRKSEASQEHQPTLFQENTSTTLSDGRRGLDIAGIPSRKQSFDASSACEPESPMMRNPFSIAPQLKPNLTNKANTNQHEIISKSHVVSDIFFADEENRTPMHNAITPAPPDHSSLHSNVVKTTPEDFEHSFEEKRAGFTLFLHNFNVLSTQLNSL